MLRDIAEYFQTEDYLVDAELREDHDAEQMDQLQKEGKYLYKAITSTDDGQESISDPYEATSFSEARDYALDDIEFPCIHIVAIVRHDESKYRYL